MFRFRMRLAAADTLIVIFAVGSVGFIWLALSAFGLIAGAVISAIALPASVVPFHRAIGRLNGNPADQKQRGESACPLCKKWCLASTDLDEPCNCPCRRCNPERV